MADKIRRTAVIGAGIMGSDLSLLLALADFNVIVSDTSKEVLDKLGEKQRKTMDELRAAGITAKKYDGVQKRITTTTSLAEINDVEFVLEAVVEDLNVKRKLFKELDERFPLYVVFATNTSSLRVSDIAQGLKGAERIGLMHFSNPPILSPLVEVMKGEKTSEETLKTIAAVAERIGKTPVVLTKDMNGAVLNRVLGSFVNDALWTIQRGEVTPEELDASLRATGFPTGFAEAVDQIGLDVALDASRILRKAYGKRAEFPEKLLVAMVKEGRLGKKSGRGFHDWSKGPPVIDTKLAGKYDVMRVYTNAANEAFWLMEDDMADPKTIDTITKLGFRSPFGMCELADSIGLDKLIEILQRMYNEYGMELYKPCPLFEEYVKNGWTGKTAGRGFHKY